MKQAFVRRAALALMIAVLGAGCASVTETEDALVVPGSKEAASSEEVIKQLLVLTKSRDLVAEAHDQMRFMVRVNMQQVRAGQILDARQQKVIEDMENKMLALIQKEFSWERQEALHIRLYQETFSKKELDGLLSFYKTATGQAIANKFPLLTRKTMLQAREIQHGVQIGASKIMQESYSEFMGAGHTGIPTTPGIPSECQVDSDCGQGKSCRNRIGGGNECR
ncbi:MAG: DUF2059 domain-containing protein [Azoarcus sp.]|jgi:hypothetical protein|nr:DUF2059 domain-containing protein [Azoarcus sp.]